MANFKISFVQVFVDKAQAMTALGSANNALPDHEHRLIDHSNQVQLRTVVGADDKLQVIGDADDKPIYMVLSLAPEE